MGPVGEGALSRRPMRTHLQYALTRHNLRVDPAVEHLHTAFTRLKGNGKELRLIVDCSDGAHPDAFNERLPRPAAPPAMMRVPTVVAVALSGSVIAVDDVATAFPTMGLCQTMQRALGVGLDKSQRRPRMRMAVTRMPQGGTWSATVCQGHTLMLAVPESQRPASIVPAGFGDVPPSRREDMSFMPCADWFRALIALRRVVHIDDVVSAGDDAVALDATRRAFRITAEARYGVRWKEFMPSSTRVVALGIDFDCATSTWGVSPDWGTRVLRHMEESPVRIDELEDLQWFMGIVGWVCQVLHIPKVGALMARSQEGMNGLRELLRARASYAVSESTLPARLQAWPRPGLWRVQLSDASGYGWGGATYEDDSSAVCGTWHACRSAGFGPVPCCAGSELYKVEPGAMIRAEAIATLMTLARARRRGDGVLILTDSMVWHDDVSKSRSASRELAALVVCLWVLADVHVAVAHVEGGDSNPMDASSRLGGVPTPLISIPPHTLPRLSAIGVARLCRHTLLPLWRIARDLLPCALRDIASPVVTRVMRAVTCRCDA